MQEIKVIEADWSIKIEGQIYQEFLMNMFNLGF